MATLEASLQHVAEAKLDALYGDEEVQRRTISNGDFKFDSNILEHHEKSGQLFPFLSGRG